MLALTDLGWDSGRDAEIAAHPGCVPGRVARPDRGSYVVLTTSGPCRAASRAAEPPTVGDWVALRPAGDLTFVEAVLPRRTAFARHGAGAATTAQVLAANVDVVFVVVGLATPPNLPRIERFLALAWESGAQPVVLLTKSDLCGYVDRAVADVASAAPGAPVHAVSSVTGDGVDAVETYLAPGRTVVLLGASGVGKSTLANRLLGAEHLATTAIRDDGKGRHTTTHRELLPLPGGAVLIDTPGLRGLQMWDASDGLDRAFADVEALARSCRFADCAHETEPGCAVRAAVADGVLDERRLASHRKLQRELRHLAMKQDVRLRAEERAKWKAIHKAVRAKGYRP